MKDNLNLGVKVEDDLIYLWKMEYNLKKYKTSLIILENEEYLLFWDNGRQHLFGNRWKTDTIIHC